MELSKQDQMKNMVSSSKNAMYVEGKMVEFHKAAQTLGYATFCCSPPPRRSRKLGLPCGVEDVDSFSRRAVSNS